MQRTTALNATMIFLGLLALGPIGYAIYKQEWPIFFETLPAVSQAIGGLLAIMATYEIARKSDERVRSYEEASADREGRFDQRAEDRAVRADKAADRRMAKADRAQLQRQVETEQRAHRLLVRTAISIGKEMADSLEALATQSDLGSSVYDDHLMREALVAIDALDAISRSSTNNASLLLQIQRLKQAISARPTMLYGSDGRAYNGNSLRTFSARIEVQIEKLLQFLPEGSDDE